MAYVGQIIDIFISSPGDVAEYRNIILSIVQAWNQRNGKSRKLFFNSLRWEDLVSPDIGRTGQDVINKQIGDSYDIFLGVMWARFGTPTEFGKSGTEEEFDRAVAMHRSGDQIRVSFLFCTADIPFSNLDGTQFANVQSFKKKAQLQGCLTRDFVDEASLINAVNLILDRFANTWATSPSDEGSIILNQSLATDLGDSDSDSLNNENDVGVLDVLDDFARYNDSFIKIMNAWSERLKSVQEKTEIATASLLDLTKFGKPAPEQVRPIINALTEEMEAFGEWGEKEIVNLEQVMERLSISSLLLIDLSNDFNEQRSDVLASKDALVNISDTILDTNVSIISYVEAIENLPRLDKMLNRANRKVVQVHRRLVEKNRLFQENIALGIGDLEKRLGPGDQACDEH